MNIQSRRTHILRRLQAGLSTFFTASLAIGNPLVLHDLVLPESGSPAFSCKRHLQSHQGDPGPGIVKLKSNMQLTDADKRFAAKIRSASATWVRDLHRYNCVRPKGRCAGPYLTKSPLAQACFLFHDQSDVEVCRLAAPEPTQGRSELRSTDIIMFLTRVLPVSSVVETGSSTIICIWHTSGEARMGVFKQSCAWNGHRLPHKVSGHNSRSPSRGYDVAIYSRNRRDRHRILKPLIVRLPSRSGAETGDALIAPLGLGGAIWSALL
jgi:hypothetical protein